MMKSFSGLLALSGIAVVFATVPISQVPRQNSFPVVPGAVIVELDAVSDVPGTHKRGLVDTHAAFYEQLDRRAIDWTVRREFKSQLFTGVSLSLKTQQDLVQLSQLTGVKQIRPVVLIPPPRILKKVIPSGPNDPQLPPDSFSTHVMTGVDKVHALGNFGKGIKIGIIDTGIDYTHPALGGKIGPGNKVAGGFDLVGDDYTGANTPVPDTDPLDQCNGHGTHVAGIIGADPNNDFNISGVASEATIFSYRVFGCSGSTSDDVIVDALLRGVSEGMDILTMSLGGSDGWTEGFASVVSSRISDSGKVVTIAAGNDGQFGSFFTSSPGNGIDAISVASIDNVVSVVQSVRTSVAHDPIAYFSLFPLPVGGAAFPIFATSTDTTVVDDACNPLPASTPDLTGKVVIVRRGTCTFVQKLTNIAAKGGTVSLIYNNGGSLGAIDVGNFTAVLIQEADGDFLVQQFAAGANVTVTFPQKNGQVNLPNTATGGLVSSFTSFGPSNDMFFKPAVGAPGGNILSTFPVPLGSFAIESGTSMATPFTAGSAALVLAAKGKSFGKNVRTLLQTTAQSVPGSLTDDVPPQTLAQQGAGLVNVFNAVTFTTSVSPGELLLNDTANFRALHPITITNSARRAQTYLVSHIPAGTAIALQPGTIQPADFPVPQTADAATIKFSQKRLTIPGGGSSTVLVTVTAPKGVDASSLPVFSGFIQIKSTSTSDNVHVSYLGLASSLKAQQVVDNTDFFFGVPTPLIIDAFGDIQTGPTTYTFQNGDFPTLLWRQVAGSPAIKIDLVSPNISIPTNLRRGIFSSWWPKIFRPQGSFASIATVGPIAEFDFIPRNSDDPNAGFNTIPLDPPTFANNTVIPNGSYRMLLRVLKITGDPTKEADYETFLSPVITVAQ